MHFTANRIRLYAAVLILIAAIVLRVFEVNSFVENIGFLAAGYLFGAAPKPAETKT